MGRTCKRGIQVMENLQFDVDGYEVITKAVRDLFNMFPKLDGERIEYATLDSESGIAIFPVSGARVLSRRESITGHVKETCLYPLYVVYRASGLNENRKANVKEWLDDLGRWLEKQTIKHNGQSYTLDHYPKLDGDREITNILRQSPSYLDNIKDDMSEDWVISITVQYNNEYDKEV